MPKQKEEEEEEEEEEEKQVEKKRKNWYCWTHECWNGTTKLAREVLFGTTVFAQTIGRLVLSLHGESTNSLI